MSSNRLGEYLKFVIKRNGIDTLSEEKKVINIIASTYEDSKEERRLLKAAYECGVIHTLISGIKSSEGDFYEAITNSHSLMDGVDTLSAQEKGDLVTTLATTIFEFRDAMPPSAVKERKRSIIWLSLSIAFLLAYAVLYILNTTDVGREIAEIKPFSNVLFEYLVIPFTTVTLMIARSFKKGRNIASVIVLFVALGVVILMPIAAYIIHGAHLLAGFIRAVGGIILLFLGIPVGAMVSAAFFAAKEEEK